MPTPELVSMAGLAVVLTIVWFSKSTKLCLGPSETTFSGSYLPLHLNGVRNKLSPVTFEDK